MQRNRQALLLGLMVACALALAGCLFLRPSKPVKPSGPIRPLADLGPYSVTLQPNGAAGIDTYIDTANVTATYGTAVLMYARYWGTNVYEKALLKFDVTSVPSTATVTSAILYLHINNQNNNPCTNTVYAILVANSDWDEATASWNYRTGSTAWAGDTGGDGGTDAGCSVAGTDYNATPLATFVSDKSVAMTDTITLDVATVQDWVNGNNYGMVIVSDDNYKNTYWETSDYSGAAVRPKLVIQYTLPEPTETPTSTPTDTPTATATSTDTPTITVTSSFTPTPSDTPTRTPTPSRTPSPTPTVTVTSVPVSWYMAGANVQRSSSITESVPGAMHPAWYRPIQSYIPANAQIICANGLLYVSTANGLYALNATTGAVEWVFPTDMPLGDSPTVIGGVVYVGGFDNKLHALYANPVTATLPTDPTTGYRVNSAELWTFTADAGFEANPVVVDNAVFIGSRDGYFYSVNATTGALLWKYATGGPIASSAAYSNTTVYFASNDAYAYALNATTGALVWKSAKLPSFGFYTWWPTCVGNYVFFGAARGYRGDPYPEMAPNHVLALHDEGYVPDGSSSANLALAYLEVMPYRRSFYMLNSVTGVEVTYDFDVDGLPEYAPLTNYGTTSGNHYPVVIASDGTPWATSFYTTTGGYSDYGNGPMGWVISTTNLVLGPWGGLGIPDEPMAFAIGGNTLYWNICSDRTGGSVNMTTGAKSYYFSYNLATVAPGYGIMITGTAYSNIGEVYGGWNGSYGSTGAQNPPIPYNGKVYMHRGNCVIAWSSSGSATSALPTAQIVSATSDMILPTQGELTDRLTAQVQKILDAGHLQPGYTPGMLSGLNPWFDNLGNYWSHPGDQFYYLSEAYAFVPITMQAAISTYLATEYISYPMKTYVSIGWNTGASRDDYTYPPEVSGAFPSYGKATQEYWDPWQNPPGGHPMGNNRWNPFMFYALWKYAQTGMANATTLFNDNASKLDAAPSDALLAEYPYAHNVYIAGYYGYLQLQQLAGFTADITKTAELTRLLDLRVTNFTKNWWTGGPDDRSRGYRQTLAPEMNFIYMVPEEASYLLANAPVTVTAALSEYLSVTPYWFVSNFPVSYAEDMLQPLYTEGTLLQAKALLLNEDYSELGKYSDVPGFVRGDLFYLHNLVLLLDTWVGPTIGTITPVTVGDIGRYQKFEASFNISNTTATNYYWPYTTTTPSGVISQTGITVDALLLAPGDTDWDSQAISVPCFYYQPMEQRGAGTAIGLVPIGAADWRFRFAPTALGVWQYKVRATDGNGTSESELGTFTCVSSGNRGYIRVSPTAPDWFEFDDGTAFIAPPVNLGDGDTMLSLYNIRAGVPRLGSAGVALIRAMLNDEGTYYVVPWGGNIYSSWGFEGTITTTDPITDHLFSFVPYYYAAQIVPAVPSATYQLTFTAKITGEQVLRVNLGGNAKCDICSATSTVHVGLGYTCEYTNTDWTSYTFTTTNGAGTSLTVALRGLYDYTDAPAPFSTVEAGSIKVVDIALQRDESGAGGWGANVLTRGDADTYRYIDQLGAARYDEVISVCEASGVYLKLPLYHKQDAIIERIQSDGTTTSVPDINNFYSGTDEAARWYEETYARYWAGRWAYSTAIHSVELANENEITTVSYDAAYAVENYLDGIVPRHVLLSNSFWGYFVYPFWGDPTYGPLMDYADMHWYANHTGSLFLISDKWQDSAAYVRESATKFDGYRAAYSYNKPIVRGEGGVAVATTAPQDPAIAAEATGTYYHKALWANMPSRGNMTAWACC